MELVSILMQAAAMESGLLARRLNSATAAYGGFGAICMVQNKWGSQLAVHSPYTLTDPMKSSNYEVPFSCGALASHHNYWILLFLASLWAFHICSHLNDDLFWPFFMRAWQTNTANHDRTSNLWKTNERTERTGTKGESNCPCTTYCY